MRGALLAAPVVAAVMLGLAGCGDSKAAESRANPAAAEAQAKGGIADPLRFVKAAYGLDKTSPDRPSTANLRYSEKPEYQPAPPRPVSRSRKRMPGAKSVGRTSTSTPALRTARSRTSRSRPERSSSHEPRVVVVGRISPLERLRRKCNCISRRSATNGSSTISLERAITGPTETRRGPCPPSSNTAGRTPRLALGAMDVVAVLSVRQIAKEHAADGGRHADPDRPRLPRRIASAPATPPRRGSRR